MRTDDGRNRTTTAAAETSGCSHIRCHFSDTRTKHTFSSEYSLSPHSPCSNIYNKIYYAGMHKSLYPYSISESMCVQCTPNIQKLSNIQQAEKKNCYEEGHIITYGNQVQRVHIFNLQKKNRSFRFCIQIGKCPKRQVPAPISIFLKNVIDVWNQTTAYGAVRLYVNGRVPAWAGYISIPFCIQCVCVF